MECKGVIIEENKILKVLQMIPKLMMIKNKKEVNNLKQKIKKFVG